MTITVSLPLPPTPPTTLLQLVQKFCLRTNIPSPSTVYGSTDSQIIQAMSLLEEEINDLASRHNWQALTREATLTTIAAEDQGDINTLDPGFRFFNNQTIWDTTTRLPIIGPMSGQQWQAMKATTANSPRYSFRFMGNHLHIWPVPVYGHVWKFEYQSRYAIADSTGTILKEFFTSDTDTFLLPDSIILAGLRWRWSAAKGLSYAELFDSYEVLVKDAMSRDGGKQKLNMDGEPVSANPRILINPMNWPL
ncbi:MAG: phage adaptor protein [Methylobacter sp.]